MYFQKPDPLKHDPGKAVPEIERPVIVPDNPTIAPPDNPPVSPPEIVPERDPAIPDNPPEINPPRQ